MCNSLHSHACTGSDRLSPWGGCGTAQDRGPGGPSHPPHASTKHASPSRLLSRGAPLRRPVTAASTVETNAHFRKVRSPVLSPPPLMQVLQLVLLDHTTRANYHRRSTARPHHLAHAGLTAWPMIIYLPGHGSLVCRYRTTRPPSAAGVCA